MAMSRRLRIPRRLRRAWRLARQALRTPRTAVVFHPRYAAAVPHAPADPLRAERILAFLASEGLAHRRCVLRPRPVSLKALARVHTAAYLDDVHDPAVLTRIMGGEVNASQVDRLLALQRLHVGGTALALRFALGQRGVGLHLGGGLHHAHAGRGGGFCVFNDVAVAIHEARHHGFSGRVLIVDLDLHDGDGTRALFADDPTVHTFSIHATSWDPDNETTTRASTDIVLGAGVDDATYLDTLHTHLPAVVEAHRPDVTVYLAGTDPAHDDQLGDWAVSADGLLARDRFVVETLRRLQGARHPLVAVLAGGYGPDAWRHSARLASVLLAGRAIEPPSTEMITLKRYRWLASLQDPLELTGGAHDNPFGLTEDDLFLPGWGAGRETRFLGYYTRHGIELTLERTGLLDRLRDLGFESPSIELQLEDSVHHTVLVFGEPEHRHRLVELRASVDRRQVPPLHLLSVEWLLLQNPTADFGPGRARLPGQEHPGLGMANDVVALLLVACERLHLDGLLWVPSHFHTAAPWRDLLVAVEPRLESQLRALLEASSVRSLGAVSRDLAAGRLLDAATGETVRWQPGPMVLPHSAKARAWAEDRRRQPTIEPPEIRVAPRRRLP